VTAILAAEVAYLESLLSKQNQKKKQKPKHPKSVNNNHIHRPKKVRPHTPKPTPAHKKPATPATEYVSKLDPFYMITAPDLSVKSESYKAVPVTEVAPIPTYGAYQEYKAAPSVPPKTSEKPSYKPSTTTLKYGDFELYQPKGYLPPTPVDPPTYTAPQKQEPTPVTYRPAHSYLPPTNKKPKSSKANYKQSQGFLPPVKQSQGYLPPVKHSQGYLPPVKQSQGYLPPVKQSQPSYKPPVSPPKYKPPPSKAYLPPINQQKTQHKAPQTNSETPKPEPPTKKAPTYEAPIPAPKYESPLPATEAPKASDETTSSMKVEEATTTTTTTAGIPVYQPTTQPPTTYRQNPNTHPHTFFHPGQAEKVHQGEWPPLYYNSLHGTHRRRRRL